MKKKELETYKNKSLVELEKDLRNFRERLSELRFNLAAGKVTNIREIRHIKKAIAIVLTHIMGKKQL